VTFPIFSSDHDTIVDKDEYQVGSVTVPVDTSKPFGDRKYYCELCLGGADMEFLVYESAKSTIHVGSGKFSYNGVVQELEPAEVSSEL
jgi:hypothetical protein